MILKISLKPLDRFFFGGENSFTEAGDEDNPRATYLLHSRRYPQQTSLLGLIRNQLLLQNDLLRDNTAKVNDWNKARPLIGKHGFRLDSTSSYGVVEKVGPVCLANDNGNTWWPAPLDDVEMEKDDHPPYTMTLVKTNGFALLQGYTEKSGLYACLQNQEAQAFPLSKAFVEKEQVGITKAARPWGNSVTENEDERGYYYQTFLQFSGGEKGIEGPTQFSFYVKFSDHPSFKLESAIVEMGGERSTFYMTVKEMDKLTEVPTPDPVQYLHTTREPGIMSLVCLSPAFVEGLASLRAHSLLQVTEFLPFRFLKSSFETNEHQRLERDDSNQKKPTGGLLESKRYELLDRGSVIHFTPENKDKITSLFTHTSLQGIGYNQFCII